MTRQSDAQKFIGESRAPRVQIEYDVEVYGSQKKVELPFVVGVMADLSGDNGDARPILEERKFAQFDTDNFDERLKQIGPTLQMHADNVLSPDGTYIDVNLAFESMQDFEPAQVVKRVPELAVLLDARNRLKELMTYMDGKGSAEDLISELLRRSLAPAVADAPPDADETPADPASEVQP